MIEINEDRPSYWNWRLRHKRYQEIPRKRHQNIKSIFWYLLIPYQNRKYTYLLVTSNTTKLILFIYNFLCIFFLHFPRRLPALARWWLWWWQKILWYEREGEREWILRGRRLSSKWQRKMSFPWLARPISFSLTCGSKATCRWHDG